ncbi:tyrosine-type recombinase/integrase [Novispirillum sp. DQ9]|uniref:tyrosine-type recombinase/integrase n=1 Tax=Novispirillum sp. DQ9 TaxID=3398612 RepID=UPI003C7C0297
MENFRRNRLRGAPRRRLPSPPAQGINLGRLYLRPDELWGAGQSFYAGLRVGEIAALTVRDVVDGQGQVRDQILLKANITKSGEDRTMFVGDKLSRELARYLASSSHDAEAAGAPLLPTQKGAAFTPNTLCQLFTRIYRLAGVDGASSHSGRRWFITRLAHSGVSPKVIMTLAGHKNLTTTQRYIEVNHEMMKAAVRLL